MVCQQRHWPLNGMDYEIPHQLERGKKYFLQVCGEADSNRQESNRTISTSGELWILQKTNTKSNIIEH